MRAALTTFALGGVTVVGACVYLVARGLATPGVAVLWQGLTYAAWVPLAVGTAWTVERAERCWGRAWAGMLAAWAPATLVHGVASAAITWAVWEPTRRGTRRPFADAVVSHLTGELPVEILQYWAIVAVLTAIEARRRLAERERAAARLEAELARARLATLRARLQPHFLFNTLQSIGLLIPRDPAAAQRMTVHLGDLLRASFRHGDGAGDGGTAEVPLGDELALVRAYVAIEAARFRDRLVVHWAADAVPADAAVPDLLVQPLVENALRHGLWPRPGRGTLTVRAGVRRGGERGGGARGGERDGEGARLVLEVEDDGAGLPAGWRDGTRDGTGLGTTRARLLALYGAHASLQVGAAPGGGTRATVILPLRHVPAGASLAFTADAGAAEPPAASRTPAARA